MAPGRLARIVGTVLDSTNVPATEGSAFLSSGSQKYDEYRYNPIYGPSGSFSIGNIAPGAYVLTAIVWKHDAQRKKSGFEIASRAVTINEAAEDLTLNLTTEKAGVMRGKFTFEGGPPPDTLRGFSVNCHRSITRQFTPMESTPITPDDQFEIASIVEPCFLQVSAGGGWGLTSIRHLGVDMTDDRIEVRPGRTVDGVEVTLTRQRAMVVGSVRRADGKPVTAYTVVAFAEDRDRWTEPTRYVRTARSDSNGQFELSLRPQTYLVVALEGPPTGAGAVPELLERLKDGATTVRVTEGSTQTVTLRVSPLPRP